jgi:hypothetical protein
VGGDPLSRGEAYGEKHKPLPKLNSLPLSAGFHLLVFQLNKTSTVKFHIREFYLAEYN